MQRKSRTFVSLVGVIDLVFKYVSFSGNNAVINLGVSGGVVVAETVILLALVGVMLISSRERSLGLFMILVGGVVNVISRIIWGGVVDYWVLGGILHNNLADYLIVGGVIKYGVEYWYEHRSTVRRRADSGREQASGGSLK